MRWRGFPPSLIQVQRGEARLVIALGVLHFLVILAFTLARVARDGFLLSHLHARKLPHVSVALAVLMLPALAGIRRLTRGASAGSGLSRLALLTGISLIGFSFWFRVGGAACGIAFYLWNGVYGLLLVSQFWILANEQIDPRQARRLFGWIGAGGVVGGLVAGVTASLAARRLVPADLMVVIAAVQGLAAAIGAWGLPRNPGAALTSAPAMDESLGATLRRPYVRSLTMLFLAGAVTSGVVDYQFKLTLQQSFPDPARMTSVLGLFYGVQSALALGAQLGLTGLLLARLGARRVSAGLPGGLLAGSVLTAMMPAFPAVLGTRLYEASMRASVSKTADEFLFFPLADATRRPVKRFIDGAVVRSADAIAGLMVLALNAVLGGTLTQLALLTAALAAGWLLLQHRLDGAYAQEMSDSLDRMLVGRAPSVSIEEAGAAAQLIPLLDSPDEKHVVYAIDRLATIAPDALRDRERDLLEHPSPVVRRRAVTLPFFGARSPETGRATSFPADPTPSDLEAQRRRLAVGLDDLDADVRRAAYRSLGLSGQPETVSLLVARLVRAQDRPVVREALAAYGARIVGVLGDYLADPRTPLRSRREIPRVLAGLGTQDAAHSLLRAAGDVNDQTLVQRTLWALDRIRKRDPTVTLPIAVVERQLRDEAKLYGRLLVWRGANLDSDHAGGARLVTRALDERLLQCRERLFRRLGLLYPPREMLRAHRALNSANARVQAQSIEFLDTVLAADHRTLLAALLAHVPEGERPWVAAARLGRPIPSPSELLCELGRSEDGWLRTCAIFAIGSTKARDLEPCIDEALSTSNRNLREVAGWARSQLEHV